MLSLGACRRAKELHIPVGCERKEGLGKSSVPAQLPSFSAARAMPTSAGARTRSKSREGVSEQASQASAVPGPRPQLLLGCRVGRREARAGEEKHAIPPLPRGLHGGMEGEIKRAVVNVRGEKWRPKRLGGSNPEPGLQGASTPGGRPGPEGTLTASSALLGPEAGRAGPRDPHPQRGPGVRPASGRLSRSWHLAPHPIPRASAESPGDATTRPVGEEEEGGRRLGRVTSAPRLLSSRGVARTGLPVAVGMRVSRGGSCCGG